MPKEYCTIEFCIDVWKHNSQDCVIPIRMQYFRLENMKYRPKTPHTAEDTPPAIALFYQSYLE